MMQLYILSIIIVVLFIILVYYKFQIYKLIKGLDQFVEGKFFNTLPPQSGSFKKISEKINLIIHGLFIEKEQVEEILQEQQLIRYEFIEFFLHAHSLYEKEKMYSLTLDSLYKMFHPEIVCFFAIQPEGLFDVYIRQIKDKNTSSLIIKKNIKHEQKVFLPYDFLSNIPCEKENLIFVPEIACGFQNVLQIPINVEKELIGMVQLYNKNDGFSAQDKEMTQTMAVFLANQLKIINILKEKKGALEKYGSIINILNDGIIIFDENKNIIMENPSARDFFSLNHTKKEILINDILNNKKYSTFNLVLFKPEKLVLKCKIDELPELSNGIHTFILILQNITESKRKEREKAELSFLTATTMHNEIKNIIKKIKDKKEIVSENIFRNINFCFSLLNKLIYYAEMDSGPLRLFKKPVKIHFLLEKFIEDNKSTYKDNKISLTFNLEESEHRIFVDSEKLELSFNLLTNFLLSKVEKCRNIFIESKFDEDRFVVRFLQVGYFYNTMELYELTKAELQIERFMQSDVEVNELNIELAYIKHILTSHGGDFFVSNEHDGTRFSFIIPY